jgi:rhomboid protease GluP
VEARWRARSEFPESDGEWVVWYPTFGIRRRGEDAVRKQLRAGGPINPVLVCSPESGGRLLPPVLLEPERLLTLASANLRQTCRILPVGMLVVVAILYAAAGLEGLAVSLGVFGFCLLFIALEARLHERDRSSISERWMFYGWCFAQGPAYPLGFLTLMLAAGLFQFLTGEMLGSQEAIRRALGLIYEDLPGSREWWRLLTAPYLHLSLEHWILNTLLGAGLLSVYGPVMGWRCVMVFLLSAPLAFAVVLGVAWTVPVDSFGILGVSGGIAGLVGCFLVANLSRPSSFPRQYHNVTIFVAATMLIIVPYFLSFTTFVAHLAGFVIGVIFGLLIDPFSPRFHRGEAATIGAK